MLNIRRVALPEVSQIASLFKHPHDIYILPNMLTLPTKLTISDQFSVQFTIGVERNVCQWSGASQKGNF